MKESSEVKKAIAEFTHEKEILSAGLKTIPSPLSVESEYCGTVHILDIIEELDNNSISQTTIALKNEIINKIKQLNQSIEEQIITTLHNNDLINSNIEKLKEKTIQTIKQDPIELNKLLNQKNLNFKTPLYIFYFSSVNEYIKEIQNVYTELGLFYVTYNNEDFVFFDSDIISSKELIKKISKTFNENTFKKETEKYKDITSHFRKTTLDIYNPETPLIVSILEKIENK